MSSRPTASTAFLITIFGVSGVLHFVRPGPFVSIVPKMLPRKKELVYLSGVCELVGAALMAHPRTRQSGGVFSAGLLAAVFPANVSMALRSGHRPLRDRVIAWTRLPLQVPMILWAWRAGRS